MSGCPASPSRSQFIQESLGCDEIGHVEAAAEPAVDRSQQITGLGALVLIAPQPREANCGTPRSIGGQRIEAPQLADRSPANYGRLWYTPTSGPSANGRSFPRGATVATEARRSRGLPHGRSRFGGVNAYALARAREALCRFLPRRRPLIRSKPSVVANRSRAMQRRTRSRRPSFCTLDIKRESGTRRRGELKLVSTLRVDWRASVSPARTPRRSSLIRSLSRALAQHGLLASRHRRVYRDCRCPRPLHGHFQQGEGQADRREDETRRMAVNFAKLPEIGGHPSSETPGVCLEGTPFFWPAAGGGASWRGAAVARRGLARLGPSSARLSAACGVAQTRELTAMARKLRRARARGALPVSTST